ncbi:hypothetical protein PHSY_003427 [Pseudozyma hubeiensis SY62]|uniref:MICOS complex subunit MIC10 n=1 Tax=Pseudozyma hubeiensis (strain SY62) TaxID=1305764 RepID=R9PCS1_PSEHS|nr:hypothetical protein PHSY_003427 [Pseudozyma hubeiensis SY62]GAC95850.1 hypothetical protein PHSY_003427 [Pseudozyma hubeiensis SY62]
MASQQASTSTTKVSSEDIISQKTDLCISNAVVKTGIGFSAGVVLSVLLFRRRAFPVWLGTGFGLGSAYTDCERSFNPVAVPGVRVVPSSSSASVSATSSAPQTTFEKLQQKAGEAFSAAKVQAADGLEKAQDKGASVVEKAEHKGQQALDAAKAEAKKIEDKYRIHSALEPATGATKHRLPGSDCLACRLTGFAAMTGLGAYSFVEAYRMGTLRRSPLPAGVKARPVWGATLVLFGLGCVGAGVIRLGM